MGKYASITPTAECVLKAFDVDPASLRNPKEYPEQHLVDYEATDTSGNAVGVFLVHGYTFERATDDSISTRDITPDVSPPDMTRTKPGIWRSPHMRLQAHFRSGYYDDGDDATATITTVRISDDAQEGMTVEKTGETRTGYIHINRDGRPDEVSERPVSDKTVALADAVSACRIGG